MTKVLWITPKRAEMEISRTSFTLTQRRKRTENLSTDNYYSYLKPAKKAHVEGNKDTALLMIRKGLIN